MPSPPRGLDVFQKLAMSIMSALVLVTFIGANLHAVLWQSSDWLVSTVLPAVVVDLTNEERADSAEAPLRRNATLDKAAQLKAQHMAEYEYFAHFSPDGVSPWHWFNEADYLFAHAGENLAIHFTDSSEVVEAWMRSPAHRENIVNGIYTEIGVGTAKGSFEGYDTVYVVQLFGTPAMAPSPVLSVEQQPLAVLSPAEPSTQPDIALAQSIELLAIEESIAEIESLIESTVVDPTEEVVIFNESEVVQVSDVLAETESQTVAEQESQSQVVLAEGQESDLVFEDIEESPLLAQADPVVIESAPVLQPETEMVEPVVLEDVVVVETPTLATSSGLAIGNITGVTPPSPEGSLASIATQPNELLEIIYLFLTVLVVSLLGTSIVVEARKFHFQQVAYGFFLLVGMAGLWFANSLLTTGAVIV